MPKWNEMLNNDGCDTRGCLEFHALWTEKNFMCRFLVCVLVNVGRKKIIECIGIRTGGRGSKSFLEKKYM